MASLYRRSNSDYADHLRLCAHCQSEPCVISLLVVTSRLSSSHLLNFDPDISTWLHKRLLTSWPAARRQSVPWRCPENGCCSETHVALRRWKNTPALDCWAEQEQGSLKLVWQRAANSITSQRDKLAEDKQSVPGFSIFQNKGWGQSKIYAFLQSVVCKWGCIGIV